MPLGLYISIPFCRTKCSYCNFASGVFSKAVHRGYIDRVCESIQQSARIAEQVGAQFEREVDSIFLGGGTPTVLDIDELERLFVTIRSTFDVSANAEITMECAPGTISSPVLQTLVKVGVNRVSLGVQSFVDQEAASVGRLHKASTVIDDVSRVRAGGISYINVDLIAGLPHQTSESWKHSLQQAILCGVPHVSVYMLEVDDDSRLGRELIAGGSRYHAHFVPDEDAVADFYEVAIEKLNGAGIRQYEISNFARDGCESLHNLKYWTRQPYLGFGVDAHSMLLACSESPGKGANSNGGCGNIRISNARGRAKDSTSATVRLKSVPSEVGRRADSKLDAVRFSTPDSLEQYPVGVALKVTPVTPIAALEETFFLGLRLNRGIDLSALIGKFGKEAMAECLAVIKDCITDGLIQQQDEVIKLTSRGRLLSNEVFERFIAVNTVHSPE